MNIISTHLTVLTMFKPLLIIVTLTLFSIKTCESYVHPNYGLDEKQLVLKYGYPLEVHTVKTEDDYLLELHRIPYGRTNNKHLKHRPAVLLVSGIACSSSTWINLDQDRSLGYILADQGYDVWMGNNRGSTWSKQHLYYNTSTHNEKYWNFTLQELGIYDTPAFVDYILNFTEQKQLFYIGYSQGTSVFFIMLSEKPEYNSKIRLMISMGTIIDLKNCKSPYNLFPMFQGDIEYLAKKFNYNEIIPRVKRITEIVQGMCSIESMTYKLCLRIVLLVSGFTAQQLNGTLIPVLASTFPNGVSVKQLFHCTQLLAGGFKKYNYGPEENLKIYGQEMPPEYNLSKVLAPVAMFHGGADTLAPPENLEGFPLPNIVYKKMVPLFKHLDVMWGIDAPELVYVDLMKVIKSYT